jgi:recombinational DNA repair protein RecT
MARDQKRHVQNREVPTVPLDAAAVFSKPPHCAKFENICSGTAYNQARKEATQTQKLERIQSCLETVAALLQTSRVYLPIFLRLEQELEIEKTKSAALARARSYLPNPN